VHSWARAPLWLFFLPFLNPLLNSVTQQGVFSGVPVTNSGTQSLEPKSKMRNISIVIVLLWTIAQAGYAQRNGEILKTENVVFPLYDSVKQLSWYYDKPAYESASKDKSVVFRRIVYSSDGLKVVAFIVSAANTGTKKHPVIIFNRGSFVRNDIAFVHAPLFQKLVKQGFVVIAPALRQSEGGEGKDELGGREIADIMNIREVFPHLPYIDSTSVFMLGESRGGMMTFLSIKNGFHLKAAATVGAITDLGQYLNERPWDEKGLKDLWPDYETKKEELYKKRSVLDWTNEINVPLLILHGTDDPQVKPDHALKLAQSLSSQKKDYQLMILNKGNHILSEPVTEDRDKYIIEWFKKHM
jgi:dipeptidyl aminopeptidase/acylaminoacyl peptidase